ncbi:DEAD/DEAH box helicase family protein, partial [Singulisphaera rosea]
MVATPEIAFRDDQLAVRFDRFDTESYDLFLRVKRLPEYQVEFHPDDETYSITAPARFASMLGVERPVGGREDLQPSKFLFDDQAAIVRMALEAKRFAVWSDCGLGKTVVFLEWARHVIHRTGGRVLIVTMNEIVPQTIDMARQFYGDSLPIHRITSRQEMREWCAGSGSGLAIVNYEKWNPEDLARQVVSEARQLAGIVLDESSRLKTGGGKQKWALIKSCRGIEYKLSCTATPAPNDVMEFASQASFLEKMRSEGEILWTYFTRDPKTHRWTVRPHARAAFFEFMAGWSIYVRDPRRYGWRAGMEPVP